MRVLRCAGHCFSLGPDIGIELSYPLCGARGSSHLRSIGRGQGPSVIGVRIGERENKGSEFGRWAGSLRDQPTGSERKLEAEGCFPTPSRTNDAAAEPGGAGHARQPESFREVLSHSISGRYLETAVGSVRRPGSRPHPAVSLPGPGLWNLDEICEWFGEQTGLRIDVAAWRTPVGSRPKSAALLVLEDRVVVRFDGRRSLRHQIQQTMHEFGHVLCDHLGGRVFQSSPGVFATGLDAVALAAAMQRDSLDSESEIQAETVGTELALMTREVAQLSPGGSGGAERRSRILEPLWTALMAVVPDVRLGNPGHLRSPIVAEHRMRVEIEDAIVALAPTPDVSGHEADGPAWARAVAEAIDHAGSEVAAGSVLAWPADERAVLAVAKAWTRLHMGSTR